jgi:hypothetical protein
MLVGTQERKKRNSPKVNLIISGIFHTLLVIGALYFAAREGLLGKKMVTMTVFLEKEKPKEVVKPKPVEPPKSIAPKPDDPKPILAKTIEPPKETAPPPSGSATVAPPAAEAPTLDFDGGREVVTGDARTVYKELIQRALQVNWERPQGIVDHTNVTEVEVAVDKKGHISDPVFKQRSGRTDWDTSVLAAIKSTTSISVPPPSNFPPRVLVQFDEQPAEAIPQP